MEYILLQPLINDNIKNVSLIERKTNLTSEEESLILHKADGPYSGFIVKKILPFDLKLDKCHLSFKLNVYMKKSGESISHQVNKELY